MLRARCLWNPRAKTQNTHHQTPVMVPGNTPPSPPAVRFVYSPDLLFGEGITDLENLFESSAHPGGHRLGRPSTRLASSRSAGLPAALARITVQQVDSRTRKLRSPETEIAQSCCAHCRHPQNIDIIDTRLRALHLRMSTE